MFHTYYPEPPDSFDLISPAHGASLDSLPVRFIWAASYDSDPGDSVHFWVYLASDSDFTADLDSHYASDTVLVCSTLVDSSTYWWRVKAFDTHGNVTFSNQTWSFSTNFTSVIPGGDVLLPTEFTLSQNHPNPFNPITQIKYTLPRDCLVTLEIYNILGQKVATLIDGSQKAGYKTAKWDAGSLSSGIYFYRLQAGDFVQTRKMVLIR